MITHTHPAEHPLLVIFPLTNKRDKNNNSLDIKPAPTSVVCGGLGLMGGGGDVGKTVGAMKAIIIIIKRVTFLVMGGAELLRHYW